MKLTGLLLLVFAGAIAVATFIENDYGTQGSKALIYNAKWFEIIMLLLTITLIINVFKYNLLKKDKLFIGLFHISFIFILIGAGITRFFGYEGIMSIKEGASSNTILSQEKYLQIMILDKNKRYLIEKKLLLSKLINNHFHEKIEINGKKIDIEFKKFIANAMETIIKDESGKPMLSLVISSKTMQREDIILDKDNSQKINGISIGFNKRDDIYLFFKDNKLQFSPKGSMSYFRMDNQEEGNYQAHKIYDFSTGILYNFGGLNIVMRNFYPKASKKIISVNKNISAKNILIVNIKSGTENSNIDLESIDGVVSKAKALKLNDMEFKISYSSKIIKLPFSVKLIDFQLDRYAGSMSPSSYASEVEVIDGDVKFPFRIYMNNILHYKDYKFFQASYDPDESGTILSVNHDYWGTLITYIGYIILGLGMFVAIFTKNSRFVYLSNKVKKNK